MWKCYAFLAAQTSGDLEVYTAWVYKTVGSQKSKEMVYTPIGGLPTINVMVCSYFGVSPKLKV